ncbi:hypothetical protein A4G19_07540 [Pasteurellaceae bacterium Macca]|nr:hypothetical protein [Pasteurellaceae bacterium Macca]
MKKLFVITSLLVASTAMAGFNGNSVPAGYQGKSKGTTTVAQAKRAAEDTYVALEGRITTQLGHERYTFQDKTGSITVEIDNDKWHGLNISPKDTVVIYGEVDKDLSRTKIDVKRINKR